MEDLRIDREEIARAAHALRALAAEALAAQPAVAARACAHEGLASAIAHVDAEHGRAAMAIHAEALALADSLERGVATLMEVDGALGHRLSTHVDSASGATGGLAHGPFESGLTHGGVRDQ